MRPTATIKALGILRPRHSGMVHPCRFPPRPPPPRNPSRCLWSGRKMPAEGPEDHIRPTLETSDSKLAATGSSLATRMATDRKFQCTRFDQRGEIYMGHGHIQRSELVSKYGILARDLRKVDESQLPAILVRQSTILVSLLSFRVLITHDDVLVLHVYTSTQGEASHVSAFMYELQGKLQLARSGHGTLPYELRALETILIMVMSEMDLEFQELREPVLQVLRELDHDVRLEKLKNLADVSRQLSAFQQKVKLIREALRTILDAEDDMAAMFLTEKAAGKPRKEADHEEVELLFENYYECCGEIMERAEQLFSDVQITRESVKSILDSHRNAIMMLEVYFSVAMLSIASGTYVAGLYGMNVLNGLEEASHGFVLTTGGSIIAMAWFALVGISRVRRISRVLRIHGAEGGVARKGVNGKKPM